MPPVILLPCHSQYHRACPTVVAYLVPAYHSQYYMTGTRGPIYRRFSTTAYHRTQCEYHALLVPSYQVSTTFMKGSRA
eukprot:3851303-Rhodomonas_salina.2